MLAKQAIENNNIFVNNTNKIVLTDAERQPCEVYTRVMGYHRPVSEFNIGKQAEHAERVFFIEYD